MEPGDLAIVIPVLPMREKVERKKRGERERRKVKGREREREQ